MSRFSPSVSMGTYQKPNYLANALQDVSGTALDLMAEHRDSRRRQQEAEAQRQFQQAERDRDFGATQARDARDFAYTQGRDAITDSRQSRVDAQTADDRTIRNYQQGIVRAGGPEEFETGDTDGNPRYRAIQGTNYLQDYTRTPDGIAATAAAQQSAKAAALADSIRKMGAGAGFQNAANMIQSTNDPDLGRGLVSSLMTEQLVTPTRNANTLDLFRKQEGIRHSYDQQGTTRVALSDGTFGEVTPQGIRRLPMVGGGEQPVKTAAARPLPSSIVEELSAMSTADQMTDDVLKIPDKDTGFGGINLFTPDAIVNRLKSGTVGSRATLAAATAAVRVALSGKTVTDGERAYLEPFIPSNADTPSAVREKLKVVKTFIARKSAALRSGGASPEPGRDTDAGGIDPDILAALRGG